jgi:orotidine-5'-phosphate decarboxylase
MPGVPFLVPGYGTQVASAADVAPAFDADGLGAVVNNSRGLIFAYNNVHHKSKFKDNWQGAVEAALADMIDDLAAHTSAGKLRS